ncbi:MAG: late competence development ComFB family protein [Gammaproteobacteria bacterium]|nr:late competence development ComFB family protein [Gammaproteobacteria bacterium]
MHLDLDIHNYYEKLVVEYLNQEPSYSEYNADFIADICCLALSHLPARYIRHEIDMAFYLSSKQRGEMTNEVKIAIVQARDYILNNPATEQS